MVAIRARAEPLSPQARPRETGTAPVILATSAAARLLHSELMRYAQGQVKGRSFLITGHRGSGKTTMVEEQLREVASSGSRMRPIPVYLNGPAILDGHLTEPPPAEPAPGPAPSPPAGAPAAAAKPAGDDPLIDRVLQAVVLALFQAAGLEFVACARRRVAMLAARPAGAADLFDPGDLAELAARFEIHLGEGPSRSELLMYWDRLGAAGGGLLFDDDDPRRDPLQGGLRELVALHTLTEAYLRVSGTITEKAEQADTKKWVRERTSGIDLKGESLVKPLASLGTGVAAAAGATAQGLGAGALALGFLTAIGAALFLKITTTRTRSAERKLNRTFMPDTRVRTLDRVVPLLIERLKAAGLAPVFVVDELDKVDKLWETLLPLVRGLKKLFAESSFTCLLVDRSYYERLLIEETQGDKGIHFSYFSHRTIVAYEPQELRDYLTELFDLER